MDLSPGGTIPPLSDLAGGMVFLTEKILARPRRFTGFVE
jgi:hypothetical protein